MSPINSETVTYEVKTPNVFMEHAILHAAALIRIRPISYHSSSPLQLVFGKEPDISHLIIF